MHLNILKGLFFVAIVLLMSGCSTKVLVTSLKPAKIDDSAIKKTAVLVFENDNYGLRDSLVSKMDSVEFDGKKYFSLVNREDTKKILAEQKLQDSGLVKIDRLKEYGLGDIDSFINGAILSTDMYSDYYYKEAYNYKRCVRYSDDKKTCIEYARYRVQCKVDNYALSASVKITNTQSAAIIYQNKYDKTYKQTKCSNDFLRELSSFQIYTKLVQDIAYDFVQTISPVKEYHSIEVIDDEDIDYSDAAESLLEKGIILLEMDDYINANRIFSQLANLTEYKSSTALYNLALTFEAMGNLEQANKFYTQAKDINLQSNDLNKVIIQAAQRIQNKIDKNAKALEQINQ